MLSVGIRGAGLAGLSFAHELLLNIPDISISIFDTRPRLPHPPRTFCFFKGNDPLLPCPPAHTWSSVVCTAPTFRRIISCRETPYTLIRGDDFFEVVLQRLESAGVSCTWGCSSVEATANRITFDSNAVDFDLVVDAAFNPDTREATLWQSFGGLWVRSKQPLFEPQVATLMDLDVPDSPASVRFMYLLPTSPTTALLEHTVFARTPLTRDEHLAACQQWAARQGFNDLEICEREYGRIPMGLQQLSHANQPLTIGTAGGAVRISTGYGFQGILKEVKQLAQSIASARAQGERLPTKAPSSWPTWMRFCDSLFVKALAKQPERGQFIMTELLRRAPESALIPFLSGTASFAQALQVMRCAPAWDMIQALTTVSDTHGEATV